MKNTVKSLLFKQFLISLVVAIIIVLISQLENFFAAIYGGFITMITTFIMSRRINSAAKEGISDKSQGYYQIAVGAIQKFVLTIVLFAVGMGWLKLSPLVILVSFALTQLSYLFNRVDTSYQSRKETGVMK